MAIEHLRDCGSLTEFLQFPTGRVVVKVEAKRVEIAGELRTLDGDLTLKRQKGVVWVVNSTLPRNFVRRGECIPDYVLEMRELPDGFMRRGELSQKPRREWLWKIIRMTQADEIRGWQIARHECFVSDAQPFLPRHILRNEQTTGMLYLPGRQIVVAKQRDVKGTQVYLIVSVHPDHPQFDDWVKSYRSMVLRLEGDHRSVTRWISILQQAATQPVAV